MKKSLKIFSLIVLGIFLIGVVNAAGYCCEKTIGSNPAWCQYKTAQTDCDSAFQKTSAFCEATSYCKAGTCVNQQEGTCMPSTESVCTDNGGFWSDKSKSELPQCKLGCCLIGDSASFVTQVSCNRMTSLYGLEVNFQPNINTELSCLANANPSVKGACVFTENYVRSCDLTTKKECQDKTKSTTLSGVEFHEGYLCSAPELETVCSKSQNTKCGEDDKVYFLDTCANLANVYDSSKVNDENYWTKIQEPTCTTTNDAGNKDSPSCGNCDFYLGSMCKQKKIGDTVDSGNFLCKDLDCKDYRGKYSGSTTGMATATSYPKHGESWCATDERNGGTAFYSPGSTSFVLTCYDGEVNEPSECDATKQEVCKETIMNEETGFRTANCKSNIWQSCILQTNSDDCLNADARDCDWITGNEWNGYYYSTDGYLKNGRDSSTPNGICVPAYQAGSTSECGVASSACYVKMERGALAGLINKNAPWRCDSKASSNCSCLDTGWGNNMNSICTLMGDCGVKKNYIGIFGYPTQQIQITEGESK